MESTGGGASLSPSRARAVGDAADVRCAGRPAAHDLKPARTTSATLHPSARLEVTALRRLKRLAFQPWSRGCQGTVPTPETEGGERAEDETVVAVP